MSLNPWKTFRQHVYDCLEQRADALFSLCDGLLSSPQARSLPELSQSPFFERKWPRVYAALADGKIDLDQLQALCVCSVLAELPTEEVVWLAVDATPAERPDAQTSQDRGYRHVSNRESFPEHGKALRFLWWGRMLRPNLRMCRGCLSHSLVLLSRVSPGVPLFKQGRSSHRATLRDSSLLAFQAALVFH